jgi:hypothetical protein
MKKLLILGGLLAMTSGAFAQGTLVFANLAGGVNAPITNSLGQRIVGPNNLLIDLYYSTTVGAATDTFIPGGFNVPFSTTTAGGGGGYFLGGTRTINGASGTIVAQVRVWDSTKGGTFNILGEWGASSPFSLTLTVPPASPAAMTGLSSFGTIIPEPSTFALAGLGAALLIFRRRK